MITGVAESVDERNLVDDQNLDPIGVESIIERLKNSCIKFNEKTHAQDHSNFESVVAKSGECR